MHTITLFILVRTQANITWLPLSFLLFGHEGGTSQQFSGLAYPKLWKHFLRPHVSYLLRSSACVLASISDFVLERFQVRVLARSSSGSQTVADTIKYAVIGITHCITFVIFQQTL